MSGHDMRARPTKWPQEIECGKDGCQEQAWLVEDEGSGYCAYECPIHGMFGVQYDDSDEDMYDPDLDFGVEFDPYEDSEDDYE